MKKESLDLASSHVALTGLAVQVHILGQAHKADELEQLEADLNEFQIRWAYCCAGISAARIDELIAGKFTEAST
ncbi:MAG: hypothetical protein RBT34_09500 [Anaerolineaceae bacterium]|nr:hypothetical protein [Anaerolineaceae bacterium]